MSLNDSSVDRDSRSNTSEKPKSRESVFVRKARADGLTAHDDFRSPDRKPGLAILDYEEGESI